NSEKPSLLIIFPARRRHILPLVADVLGQPWAPIERTTDADSLPPSTIAGLAASDCRPSDWAQRTQSRKRSGASRTLIRLRCVDEEDEADWLGSVVDYEYLFASAPFYRRDLARFLSFVLGQVRPHRQLARKARTTFISTTFPDVHAALPNLEILSVGADAVELRVDLLKETLPDGSVAPVPSLAYVGEQLMLLRQRTELPIIYTTRCTAENGRFPMHDPGLFYTYLSKAIQWGCEYIDVELWLPEPIRAALATEKGHSKIISAFHDFSRAWTWAAPRAMELFTQGAVYGDVIKMIALVDSPHENWALEHFRAHLAASSPSPPFSGLNMGPVGQLSRSLNKIFTPITHPLLPMIAAPGQLSAAEINAALHTMGALPRLSFFGLGLGAQAPFYEQCFNELSLPHAFTQLDARGPAALAALLAAPDFGGAVLAPPAPCAGVAAEPTPAARAIGLVDTLIAGGRDGVCVADNAAWKGVRGALVAGSVPSAFSGRAAVVVGGSTGAAGAALFALAQLGAGPLFVYGFEGVVGGVGAAVRGVRGVEDVSVPGGVGAVVCCAGVGNGERAFVEGVLRGAGGSGSGGVFVDLGGKGGLVSRAVGWGWRGVDAEEVDAWTTVETLRLLVGQNVPYDFVRLAGGGG
ncbi:aldolase, partial [Trichodelitschia bisporula]